MKKTRFLLNFEADNLKLTCNRGTTLSVATGQQVFATSTEAEYPWPLSKQLAFAFLQQMQLQGKPTDNVTPTMDVRQRMGAGTQPRGKLAPLLLSEFKCKVVVTSCNVQVPKVITKKVSAPFHGIPLYIKRISTRSEVRTGEVGEVEFQISEFGVFRSPSEFLMMASLLQHPLHSPQLVESSNLRAILAVRDWSTAEMISFRARSLKH